MKRSLYGERDHAFGQIMQALRMTIGLTQVELADLLEVSRYAIGGWETGQSYPKAEHLKHFITLGLQKHAFSVGQESEEIRKLWQASHQKVLLDESWLYALLSEQDYRLPPVPVEQNHNHKPVSAPSKNEQQVDWDDALDLYTFHGRKEELALLSRWIIQEHCRVVSIVGMGGIGKSALATKVMRLVAEQFDVVIWRSLRNEPSCDVLVDACLQILAPQTRQHMPHSLESSIRILMKHLREQRVLLVLDNLEMILEDGTDAGRLHAGAEGYAYLLQRIGETMHQSCLLLTSREKPAALVPLEGRRSQVLTLRLAGLDAEAGAQLLAEKDVVGSPHDQRRLVEAYRGHPLALKIVAQTIVELFGGEIDSFFKQGELIFGGVRELLDEHFEQLSTLEQSTLLWLAILREPVSLEQLVAVLNVPRSPMQILEALGRLHQSSLIEQGHRGGTFTLHSVVLEYATARLITKACSEIEQGQLDHFKEHGLCQAQGREYLRRTQERLLMVPLLTRLQSIYGGQATLEAHLLWLLDQLRNKGQTVQGYGPANLVTLLRLLRGDLRNLDLARLALRSLSLQGVEMQDASLSEAILRDATFSEAIDAIMVVAVSRTGLHWAAATRQGYVRIWQEAGRTLRQVWQAHISGITALVFSPDGHTLATAGWDNTVRLWNSATGTLLWTGKPTGGINCITFAPNGHLLATSGNDALVRFWDLRSSTSVQTLAGQGGAVYSLAWSPDGSLLVRGCSDGSIRLWRLQETLSGDQEHILTGHTRWVTGLDFAPNGTQLASASVDGTVKLWDTENLECLQTFSGHTDRVLRVAWSPDGHTLASCSFDQTIWLWDIKEKRSRTVLYGHNGLHSITFTPDSQTLLSGSNDGTIRVWDVASGQCLRIIGGYHTNSLLDVDWSPDNDRLASGGADSLVTLWKTASTPSPMVWRGHSWIVQGVAWSPDGQLLASSGYDNSIRLWDTDTGLCLRLLKDSDAIDSIFFGIAWSPDGRLLACGTFLPGVQVWDMVTNSRRWIRRTGATLIRRVAWSPDGAQVAGGGDDGYVYVWDRDGVQKRLTGHHGAVMSVAWSPDGIHMASSGGSIESGEIFMWDSDTEGPGHALVKHPDAISAITWSPDGEELISGDADGKLCWWKVQSGQCLRVQAGHQGMVQALKISPDGNRLASCGDDGAILIWNLHSGQHLQTLRRDRPYERLNITGIRGVTEAERASLRALGAVEETDIKR